MATDSQLPGVATSSKHVADELTEKGFEALKNIGKAAPSEGIREVVGTVKDAQAAFKVLSQGGEAIKNATYPGTLVKLSDGTIVGFRTTATKSGANTVATIDINKPGLDIRKVKFNKEERRPDDEPE